MHDHAFHKPDLKTKERKILTILILVQGLGMLVEVIGGLLTHSLALLSDAAHMFTHLFSLFASYFAITISMRETDATMSFGYHRAEILAAFFNAITVFAIVLLIFAEGVQNLFHPRPILAREMFAVAIFGLVINLSGAFLLFGVAKKDLNLKSVVVHLLSDTFSSVAIVIGGIVIQKTQWYVVDALLSIGIAGVIGIWGWGLLRRSSKILLQAVPEGIKTQEVVKAILEVPGVKGVHDVHIWELTSGKYVMSGHLLTEDGLISKSQEILHRVNHLLHDKFLIGHATFQFEVWKDDQVCHGNCQGG